MIPKRLITTWICDPARDRYTERHREMFAHCHTSWLRLMPDYELVVITLGSLTNAERGTGYLASAADDLWLKDRLTDGNWIAASHWARLEALYRLGGIYLDADVEAVARFDSLLDLPFTVGHLGNGQRFANNAVIAAQAGHPLLTTWLDATKQQNHTHPEFGNNSGPFLLTDLLKMYHWDGEDRDVLFPAAGVCVRRSKVFYPYTWNQSYSPACHASDTLAVHHWASAWRALAQQPHQSWREEGRCVTSLW